MRGYAPMSIIDIRGDRWYFEHARILGLRDGYLFVEETDPATGDATEPAPNQIFSVQRVPLDDITRVNVEAVEDDTHDEKSTTYRMLLESGEIDPAGRLRS